MAVEYTIFDSTKEARIMTSSIGLEMGEVFYTNPVDHILDAVILQNTFVGAMRVLAEGGLSEFTFK